LDGPSIVAHTLSRPGKADKFGNAWQYHSRSDRHSKVACWALMFELLEHSATLRRHVESGQVVFGVNQELKDFGTNRSKNLDLVIATPAGPKTTTTMGDLALRWGVRLTSEQQDRLASLPTMVEGPTSMVRVALEAKACMTAHMKARPRLFDELSQSYTTIHGHNDATIAAGLVMINNSSTFVSTDLNKWDLTQHHAVVSIHPQPKWTRSVIDKVKDIHRRTRSNDPGFDALGIVVVDLANDGSPMKVVTVPPAPDLRDVYHYDRLVQRIVELYDSKYANV
jgi:hypothetical protein